VYASVRGTQLFFDVDGASLRTVDGGGFDERPTLVLVHGGPGSTHAGYKRGSVARLAETCQLVYYDQSGCGLSAGEPNDSIDGDVADLEALREHLGLEQLALLGTSYGGMVAQGYAIAHGARLSALVLNCTAPSFRFLAEAKAALAARGTAEQQRVAERLWTGSFASTEDLREFYEAMGPLYANDYVAGQASAEWGVERMSYRAANAGFGGFLRRFDFVDRLAGIGCPTLVLAGATDWICAPEQARLIASKVPGARLHVFAGSGHGLADDEPDRFVRVVSEFLSTSRQPR
jgi:proline iminopeptidase